MALTFNGYELPNVQTVLKPVGVRLRTSETIGRGGVFSQGGLLAAKRITVTGLLKASGLDALNSQWDDLNSNLPIGSSYPLVIEPGRRYQAEIEAVTDSINPQFQKIDYEVQFLVPAGCSESDTETSATLATSGGTVSVSGNYFALPRFAITVSAVSSGSTGTITLNNTTTSETIIILPSATGVYYIDSDTETILRGSTDSMSDWSSGPFISLMADTSNTITLTTSGVTVSALSCSFRSRWR